MFEKNSQISCQDHGFGGNIGSLNQQIIHNRRAHEPNVMHRNATTNDACYDKLRSDFLLATTSFFNRMALHALLEDLNEMIP